MRVSSRHNLNNHANLFTTILEDMNFYVWAQCWKSFYILGHKETSCWYWDPMADDWKKWCGAYEMLAFWATFLAFGERLPGRKADLLVKLPLKQLPGKIALSTEEKEQVRLDPRVKRILIQMSSLDFILDIITWLIPALAWEPTDNASSHLQAPSLRYFDGVDSVDRKKKAT